jgi:hypothetical protein
MKRLDVDSASKTVMLVPETLRYKIGTSFKLQRERSAYKADKSSSI